MTAEQVLAMVREEAEHARSMTEHSRQMESERQRDGKKELEFYASGAANAFEMMAERLESVIRTAESFA